LTGAKGNIFGVNLGTMGIFDEAVDFGLESLERFREV
jgi:hypothetical protein